jgi:hexokinase
MSDTNELVANFLSMFKNSRQAKTNTIVSEDEILADMEELFVVGPTKLKEIVKHFVSEMQKGLDHDGATVAMLPSFVTNRPTGKEQGSYLALDLGGTNFRVCEVYLEGQCSVRLRQKKFTIPEECKNAEGEVLFDFLANSVESFLKDSGVVPTQQNLELGFTFSFPVEQTAINAGNLLVWSKGFNCTNTVGKDVVEMLNQAFIRKGLNVKVTALVNDTVGTLISHAYNDPQTLVGVILGTGTNAAYVEKIENVKKWKGAIPASGEMIINCEWGAYDEEKAMLPLTQYDNKLDAESQNQGKHIYEKMISGMSLGEICRNVFLDLIQKKYLFNGYLSEELKKPNSFETQYMSRIERDYSADLSDTKIVLQDLLGIPNTTARDRRIVRRIVELVGIRAARLSACCIAGLITQMKKLDGCTVAIDGSVFEHYPHFGNRIQDALHELLGLFAENITLALGKDGSGIGAGIIAALAD